MEMEKGASNKLEWRINVGEGKSEVLVPEKTGLIHRFLLFLQVLVVEGLVRKVQRFLEKAWGIAVAEPKKVIHCLKVGVALATVSLFYYMRPLYDGFGGNAMWAIMTVVVVFENTVGATICKSFNRVTGTFLAGSLGIGVHWVAHKSGDQFEPIIVGISIFLLTSAATFSRFIPSVKSRFDYGAMIFILTFSLVSVSGYRVDKLIEVAHERLSTIAIGTSLCLLISMLFYPIWAGKELHKLIHRNLEKLADSIEGCVGGYFTDNSDEEPIRKSQGYKCVLNSKGTEDALAAFARWEPAHGHFNFRHPWDQYLKIGASLRRCACCLEALNGCINTEIQAPAYLKKHLFNSSLSLSSHASNVLKELAITIKTMRKSSSIDLLIGEMQLSVQELQNALITLPNNHTTTKIPPPTLNGDMKAESVTGTSTPPSIMEVLPLATLVSLLTETSARIEEVADAVKELAALADFKPPADKKTNQSQAS